MGIPPRSIEDSPIVKIPETGSPDSNGKSHTILVTLIALAGFAVNVYVFFPGLVSSDSIDQYLQAQHHQYSDWHPAFMAAVWSSLLPVFPGATGMLVLISACLWFGLAGIAARLANQFGRRGLVVFVVPLLPVVINFSGMIWKDVLHASFWLTACGILATQRPASQARSDVARLLFVLLFIFAGILVRPNAVFAAIPLVAWGFRRNSVPTMVIATAASLCLCAGLAVGINRILSVAHTHPESSIQVYNLGGISFYIGQNVFPGQWSDEESKKISQVCFSASSWNNFAWGDPASPKDCSFVVRKLHEQGLWGTAAFGRAWMNQILSHPDAYVRSRLQAFRSFLRDPELRSFIEHAQIIHGQRTDAFQDYGPVTRAVARYGERFANSALATPRYWCLAAVAMMFWTTWRWSGLSEPAKLAYVMTTSAVFYVLSYGPLGVASDLRYFYWPYIAIAVSALIVVLDLFDGNPGIPRRAPRTISAVTAATTGVLLLAVWFPLSA